MWLFFTFLKQLSLIFLKYFGFSGGTQLGTTARENVIISTDSFQLRPILLPNKDEVQYVRILVSGYYATKNNVSVHNIYLEKVVKLSRIAVLDNKLPKDYAILLHLTCIRCIFTVFDGQQRNSFRCEFFLQYIKISSNYRDKTTNYYGWW
jgi:hypothetical protein